MIYDWSKKDLLAAKIKDASGRYLTNKHIFKIDTETGEVFQFRTDSGGQILTQNGRSQIKVTKENPPLTVEFVNENPKA